MGYKYIYEHEPSNAPDESGVYRSKRCLPSKELYSTIEDLTTVYDLIIEKTSKFGNLPCCGHRDILGKVEEDKEIEKIISGEIVKEIKTWSFLKLSKFKWWSYNEFFDNCEKLAFGLRKLGLNPKDKVALFAPTSPFWSSLTYGCFTQNLSVVTIYDSLGEEGLQYALDECKITAIFTTTQHLNIIKNVMSAINTLKIIIYHGELVDKDKTEFQEETINLISYNDLVELGKANIIEHVKPDKEDLACIMYTSGTTGKPKGVLITHANIIATISGVNELVKDIITPEDILIFFLPLSHIFAFIVDIYMFYRGVLVGYSNPRTLLESSVRECKGDFQELSPTLMIGVPQVFDAIRKGIMIKAKGSGAIMNFLFTGALKLKQFLVHFGIPTLLSDKFIFEKIKSQTGGRLRMAVSGGAPLSEEVRKFISNTICLLTQGYGLTESCGLSFIMHPNNIQQSCIGEIVSQNEFKLKDFTEGGYSHKNPIKQGELWLRGNSIAKGYYKNAKSTSEAFTPDGWFQTGDIVQINADGQVSIIDRKKNLVKLANGEYIALEKLESIYKNSEYVQNICIIADSHYSKPIALIVPDINPFKSLAQQLNLPEPYELSDLDDKKAFIDAVYKSCISEGKKAGLKTSELISGLFICRELWTPENGLITAAQKLKRRAIAERYKLNIEKLH